MLKSAIRPTLLICLAIALFISLSSCSGENKKKETAPLPAPAEKVTGCQSCHPVLLDSNHQIPCISCHGGNDAAAVKELAHSGVIATPGHPDTMAATCGKCHKDTVHQAAQSLHFTMARMTNMVRKAFGAQDTLDSLTEIPKHPQIETLLDLTDDLLRRRCLRCHLFSAGDDYPETSRGTGCAACHLHFENGVLVSHEFVGKPADRQCLSCHYGNRVGADFYGRFEHDFSWEYQTPFALPEQAQEPPYGLQYHQLSPDIHQQKGMACIDCHSGEELMTGNPAKLTCESCHLWTSRHQKLPPHTRETENGLAITLQLSETERIIPQIMDPIHTMSSGKAGCLVCHAQWGYNDQGTHLMRLDDPSFEQWFALTRQGSSEIETLLNTNIFTEGAAPVSQMTDAITGEPSVGAWLKSFELRRWEPLFCRDRHNILQVCRPLLDLHLSYVNDDGEVVFDSAAPTSDTDKIVPYTAHTVGAAGSFYQQRLNSSQKKGQ